MDKFVSFLKNKTFLITLGVLLALLIILVAGFFSMKSYLQKTVYPDFSLILYDEAHRVLSETRLAPVSLPFLYAVDKMFPEMFVHVPTGQEMEVFDYTKQPAVFKVLSADRVSKTLDLQVVLPSFMAGAGTISKISCFIDSTEAVESKPAGEEILADDSLLDGSKLANLFRKLSSKNTDLFYNEKRLFRIVQFRNFA